MRKIFIRIFSCLVACALFTFSAVGVANAAADFSVKINSLSKNEKFYFSLSANGNYRIDLGRAGKVGTSDSSCGSVSKSTATRYVINKTSAGAVDCVYYYYPNSSGSDIWLEFIQQTQPTSYNTSAPAIGFYVYQRASYINNSSYDSQKAANAAKITAISIDNTTDGSLAALFPYRGSNSGQYPLFTKTFYKATNLTSIPSTLFASNNYKYTNLTGANGMFESMFEGCTGLQNVQTQNSTGLFQYITSGGERMFKNMFKGCSQLTTINSDFNNLQSGAAYMFDSTFMGCSQLTTVPKFSALRSGANYMFNSTFEGCYRLPFSNMTTSMFGALSSGGQYMFNRTFANAGTSNTTNTLSNKIFPSTLTQGQPYMFNETFSGCSTLTLGGTGNNSLFYSITGGANYLFRNTFQGCSKLNTQLIFQVTAPYQGMFYGTFRQCTSLTSLANIFTNVSSVNGAQEMFYQTYYGCSNLSPFPTSTFSKISSPAQDMFYQTFYGCNALSSFIPPAFFNKLIAAGSPLPNNSTNNMLNGMFDSTNILTSCPSGYSQFITGYENYWNTSTPHKVSCDSNSNLQTVTYNCNGGSGVSGSDQTFNGAVYTTRQNNCSRAGYTLRNGGAWTVGSGTTTIAQNQKLQWTRGTTTLTAQWNANTIGLSWDGGGTPQFCTYGDTFNVPTPESRTGYVFTGWQIDN